VWVEHRREVQGDDDVFRAHGHPRAEEAGSSVPQKVRPVVAATAFPPASRSTSRPRAGSPRGSQAGVDNYWQTETAGRSSPSRPEHRGIARQVRLARRARLRLRPAPVRCGHGEEVGEDTKGVLAIRGPLPPGCMTTVWGDDQRFVRHLLNSVPGQTVYSTFDWGIRDRDGYYFILGRTDDVNHVAGTASARARSRSRSPRTRTSPRFAVVGVPRPAERARWRSRYAIVKDTSLIDTPAKRLAHEATWMKAGGRPARRGGAAGARAFRGRAAQDPLGQAAAPLDPRAVRGPGPGGPDDDRGTRRRSSRSSPPSGLIHLRRAHPPKRRAAPPSDSPPSGGSSCAIVTWNTASLAAASAGEAITERPAIRKVSSAPNATSMPLVRA